MAANIFENSWSKQLASQRGTRARSGVMLTLDATLVLLLIGLVLPTIVGLVTKVNAPPAVKYIVALFVSSVTALIVTHETASGVAVISKEMALAALVEFLVTTLTYLGFYKPVAANAVLAPNFGIGPRKAA